MKKLILFICFGLASWNTSASLIQYDITNNLVNLETNEEFVEKMKVVFDSEAAELILMEIDVLGTTWKFSGNIDVSQSATLWPPNLYEIFAYFSVPNLTNPVLETAVFMASEWKVYHSSLNINVLEELGSFGPSGIGLFSTGDLRFGVTSNFDRKTVVRVSEPPMLVIFLLALLAMATSRNVQKKG